MPRAAKVHAAIAAALLLACALPKAACAQTPPAPAVPEAIAAPDTEDV